MYGDEVWDENKWEAFLRENDRRLDRYTADLYEFLRSNPRPHNRDPDLLKSWIAELRAYLFSRGWRHVDFSMDETGEEGEEIDAGGIGPPSEPPLFEDLDADDVQEDFHSLADMPVYQSVIDLGNDVLEWANSLPGDVKDSTLVHFCSSVMQMASHIAEGHRMGYEQEMIGGNIACSKRGLAAGNVALQLMQEMKNAPYFEPETYRKLYERIYEARNALALHVQELRQQFNLGID